MAGDQKGELSKKEKLFLEEFTASMDKACKDQLRKFRQDIQQQRKGRSSRDEYKKKEFDQMDRNWKHAGLKYQIPSFHGQADPEAYVKWEKKIELIFSSQHYAKKKKIQMATAEFCGHALRWWNQLIKCRRLDGKEPVETWLKLRALMRREYVPRQYHKEVIQKQPETKLCSSLSVQKQPDSKRSSPSSNLVSSSKTSTYSFEDSIRKAISQAFRDVEKQLKQSKTISPSLEVQNQALSSTVSELKDAEPDSVAQSDLAALVQEDQTEIPTITIQKDDQPIKDDLILFKQDVIEEEAPMESKSDSGVEHLFVTDSNGFQRTFLGTFLISPFVWNKTRAVELSRHQLGMEHVVFEPGGELWNHRNNPIVIEKKSAATTIVFGDLLPSEANGMHVSDQQEFHYETNWRMLPTLSWIQQTRKRSKWPPDHQDIVNSAKHIGLAKFCELLISDWGGRLQFYLWKPGAYSRILIILGECSARSRTSWGNKELEADQNSLLLGHVKIWKPPDMQQLQHHYKDYQTMSGDGGFTGENGEVITGSGEELMFSSQIKEKPPDQHSLQQTPKQPTRGIYLNSKKNMKPDLLAVRTGQTVLSSTLFEKRAYSYQSINDESLAKLETQQANLGSCLAASLDIGAVRGSYLNHHKELISKIDCHGNLTHQGLTSDWNHDQSFSDERVMGSTSRLILCVLCLNFSEFKTSQSYLWRPGEHPKVIDHVFKNYFCIVYTDMMHFSLSKEPCADYDETLKHTRRNYKREEDKRFKPPDLDQDKHKGVPGFVLIKEAPPDAAYHPKPSKNLFGIRLLLFDKSSYTNLLYFIVCKSGLRNASVVWRAQHKTDLRSNPFQEGGDDVIMDQLVDEDALAIPEGPNTCSRSKKLNEADGEILKMSRKQEDCLGCSLINQDTLTTIQATPPSS
ncbi:uncharacterized protein LOC103847828 isoform X1 [Brassica rapa]|uniref:uncharacterized protein LOC103847828 isoform X1 n=1 Tax=Brassica campestris TaxID=3711 RepID=UPI00142DDFB1|nr:uncharacterized protein LOC103847828 isoform X1 [Brassica rapa]